MSGRDFYSLYSLPKLRLIFFFLGGGGFFLPEFDPKNFLVQIVWYKKSSSEIKRSFGYIKIIDF